VTAVSVVVPHFGDPRPTLDLIAMLCQQRTTYDFEVIVSDDASPSPFPPVVGTTVVRRAANGGFGRAVNSGVKVAKNPMLLILNSDVSIDENFLECMVDAAAPWMPAVASPRVTAPDGQAAWTGRHFPLVRHQFFEWLTPLARWRGRNALHEAVGHDTRAASGVTAVVDWVVGAAMMMPTAEFRAVGGFDERFFMNSEEVDLQRRLRQRGLPSVALGAPTLLHEGGGSSSDPERRRAWLVRSRFVYASKWGGRRRLTAALLAATAVNLAWNSGRRALGRPVRPWATARLELSMLDRKKQP
jgi:N-acetylglucosaminyl-diphospho-decaprenol L-rhamnosyltransferase